MFREFTYKKPLGQVGYREVVSFSYVRDGAAKLSHNCAGAVIDLGMCPHFENAREEIALPIQRAECLTKDRCEARIQQSTLLVIDSSAPEKVFVEVELAPLGSELGLPVLLQLESPSLSVKYELPLSEFSERSGVLRLSGK